MLISRTMEIISAAVSLVLLRQLEDVVAFESMSCKWCSPRINPQTLSLFFSSSNSVQVLWKISCQIEMLAAAY